MGQQLGTQDPKGLVLAAIGDQDLIRVEPKYTQALTDADLAKIFADMPPIPKDALIVVNDHFRSTPSSRIIKVLREIAKLTEPVTFIVATGTHKPPSRELGLQLTGASDQDQLLLHNVYAEQDYYAAGKTKRKTDVKVIQIAKDAECVLTINGVEPHYFAGFTGGVKSIIPGIAHKATVEQNHAWAITPKAKVMRTKGNPVFEDLWDALNLIRPEEEIRTIQLVNHDADILYATWGSLRQAFERAKKIATRIYGIQIDARVDRLIPLVCSPLDKNLYQSQKAMENTKNVLRDGGTSAMVVQCDDGIGTAAFFERLQSKDSAQEIVKSLYFDNYKFGDHKAFYWAELATRVELLYVGDLPQDTVSVGFMNKVEPEELGELVKKWLAQGDRVLLDCAGGFSALYLLGRIR